MLYRYGLVLSHIRKRYVVNKAADTAPENVRYDDHSVSILILFLNKFRKIFNSQNEQIETLDERYSTGKVWYG